MILGQQETKKKKEKDKEGICIGGHVHTLCLGYFQYRTGQGTGVYFESICGDPFEFDWDQMVSVFFPQPKHPNN